MPTARPRFLPHLTAMALACAVTAHADVVGTGSIGVGPVPSPIGPGDTVLPTTGVWVGSSGVGSATADKGSFLQLARLSFGSGGTGSGTGLITGAGTKVELVGDGSSNSQVQRLVIGDWGTGQLTVKAGAVLDTRGNQAPCLLAFHRCDSFVGGAAGDSAELNIDGAGTQVRIGQSLFVAQPGLAIQHLDGHTYGVPGGTTRGTVNVTNGALLSTDRATVGPRHWSTNATGRERNIAEVNVSGAGSRWVVVGGSTVDHSNGTVFEPGAYILTANDRNAWATINVTNGGEIAIQGVSGVFNGINLTNGGQGGGRTDMLVSGVGSRLSFSDDATYLQVGRKLGSANLTLNAGGRVTGLWYGSVGRDASFGELLVDGAGSLLSMTGMASTAASGSMQNAVFDIGRNGTGKVTVSNGGRIELTATEARSNGPNLNIGREAASSGALAITGAGSVVALSALSTLPGGGGTEAFNPFVRVGRDGNGTLNISGGGKLLMDGQAVSTVADSRGTSLYVGGTGDSTVGGKGIALVTGAGSEVRMTGSDTFIAVGIGPQSFGQLTVADGASISANGMNVGRSGGVGVLAIDRAQINFSGQQTGGVLAGAFLSIGRSGGTGIANIGNGSTVTMSNLGSSGASLNLGGTGPGPLGDGTITLSGGSQIRIQAAPGLGVLSVARDGSGLMRVRGGSTVDVGDGSAYIGRLKGSDGTLIISEASSLTAGWVGVGRNKTLTGDVDGGTGTLVLINSTLTASDIVIGTNGFLGGTGKITGNLVNHGIFAPGQSPGTMEIAGGFTAAAGSRMILEVQSDGHGGFATDHVIFGNGQVLDLAHLSVEYRFLGDTNPNDFQAQQLFDVDTFFQVRTAGGGTVDLAPQAFNGATFSAQADTYTITNFSFSASGGASFTATPVPEPGAWVMLLAGLAGLAGARGAGARRRSPA